MYNYYTEIKYMITMEQIKQHIAEAIKHSGMTQTELAKKLDVKQQQISCYIKGQKAPSLDTLAKLCAVLDVDANEILCVNKYLTE